MLKKLLVANRGEIAVRVLRAAADLQLPALAVYSADDVSALHVRMAPEAQPLPGTGVDAYLDAPGLVAVARESGCDAVHPGYGFLSESAAFARLCEDSGLTFVGPRAETLEVLGDKLQARRLAEQCAVPVLAASAGPVSSEEAREFLASLGPDRAMVIKAVAGGGGRGMRVVTGPEEVAAAWERCESEARRAFGDGSLYCEEYLPGARHIEVQVLGDGSGEVTHLRERDCSVQRRHQKLVEVAPAPGLGMALRSEIVAAALRMAESAGYRSLGTFEFLVAGDQFAFIEANPRLQVEHTVTEAVLGIDLVQAQLLVAGGARLEEAGLTQADVPEPRGFAIQFRVNAEAVGHDGSVRAASGTLSTFEPPSGPGVRVDTAGFAGLRLNPNFDSLLAKVICHSTSPRFEDAARRAGRALGEFRLSGVSTNLGLLQAIASHAGFRAGGVTTEFFEAELPALLAAAAPRSLQTSSTGVGARVDATDPLAVLAYGKSGEAREEPVAEEPVAAWDEPPEVEGVAVVRAPMQGTVLSVDVGPGDSVAAGQQLAILNAMKMEHVLAAEASGVVTAVSVAAGEAVAEGQPLLTLELSAGPGAAPALVTAADLDTIRRDLDEVLQRQAKTLDAARPEAVARRRKTGQRTARENVDDLCDAGSFVEYGSLVIAAQRQRRSLEDLVANTPADGMITGIGRVNGDLFGPVKSRTIVMSYDYTVLAGTQGSQNHAKKDRMFELAERLRLPVVLFAEGGGGRPGDTDKSGVAGLDTMAFHLFGKLSGLVPLVGITSGRCFAGNAALLGCCDVVIATANSNIGMGGPAMVEGGGLGVFRPEEIGPMDVQVPNGVVDVPVKDEEEAVAVAKRYLSYFQGPTADWECADQRLLRTLVPENRLRVYDVRGVIETMADIGSVLELRRNFGLAMVTVLARVEGRPVGIVANNPAYLSGAIDSPAADKAARFLQLCDSFDIPVVFLCDTPGIMVGPEVEKTALVRHASRLFVTGASMTVPYMTIVLRKSYGLGAQAMAGGSHKAPYFSVSWPTGEFGGMGLEGAVKLGYRKELEAISDSEERNRAFEEMVARSYQRGKALNTASHFEIDDVIDPAETRARIVAALESEPLPGPREGKKRPFIDTW